MGLALDCLTMPMLIPAFPLKYVFVFLSSESISALPISRNLTRKSFLGATIIFSNSSGFSKDATVVTEYSRSFEISFPAGFSIFCFLT